MDVDWLAAFDITFSAAADEENTLYLLYEEEDGTVMQEKYKIDHPFDITFEKNEWVRRFRHNGNGNIIIFIERTAAVGSNSASEQSAQGSPSSSNSSYWCDDLDKVKLKVGNNGKVLWAKVNLRSSPEVPQVWDQNIVAQLDQGVRLTVVDGPECAHNGTWWEVRTEYGDTGWSREYTESNGYLIGR